MSYPHKEGIVCLSSCLALVCYLSQIYRRCDKIIAHMSHDRTKGRQSFYTIALKGDEMDFFDK